MISIITRIHDILNHFSNDKLRKKINSKTYRCEVSTKNVDVENLSINVDICRKLSMNKIMLFMSKICRKLSITCRILLFLIMTYNDEEI